MNENKSPSAVPSFVNSIDKSIIVDSKSYYRYSRNFLEVDPRFDFQLNSMKFKSANPVLSCHIHATAAEIVFVLRGSQHHNIDGNSFQALGGEMILSPPGLVHSSENQHQPKGEFYYITINPACIAEIFSQDEENCVKAFTDLLLAPPHICSIPDTNRLRTILDELLELHGSTLPYRKLRIRCALCNLLLFMTDALTAQKLDETYSDFMHDVYLYIEDHVYEKLSIDMLADHFQYSKNGFRNKFKGYAHLTVHEYILHRKIETAKMLLADSSVDPHKLWEMLSFSSASYFNQAFKRYTGMTAIQYARSLEN
ncbi:MAG: helix-turn-helix domain-containing protein [Clostridia bacterium]|nr:helix-turn-helix domain-containing protein [Clostridia bacterium]